MNEEQIDVTTETTDASSAENQTDVSQESQTDQSGSSEDKKVSESVPYDRFAEVNSTNKVLKEEREALRKELEEIKGRLDTFKAPQQPQSQQEIAQRQQEELVKRQLREMGFVDQSEVEKRLQQIDEDRKLENRIQSLENKYSGKDGRPKFNRREILEYARDNQIGDIEAAYKLKNQDALIDYAIKQAQGKVKPVKSESSDGSGSQNAGTTNDDLISAARKGDKSSLLSFIKRQM